MSIFTKIARAIGLGSVLDKIEGVEAAVKTHVANPTPDTAAAVAAATTEAKAAVVAAASGTSVKQTETVAIDDIGNLLKATAVSLIAKKLGPAAPIAETIVTDLVADFEEFITARLPA